MLLSARENHLKKVTKINVIKVPVNAINRKIESKMS